MSQERRATFASAETDLQYPALVFIKGFLGDKLVMSQEDAIRNSPFFNTRVVYAQDFGEKNKNFNIYFPNHFKYLGTYNIQLKRPEFKIIND